MVLHLPAVPRHLGVQAERDARVARPSRHVVVWSRRALSALCAVVIVWWLWLWKGVVGFLVYLSLVVNCALCRNTTNLFGSCFILVCEVLRYSCVACFALA